MLGYIYPPRYWSPRQDYATGDALLSLLNEGWQVHAWQPAPMRHRAPLYAVTLKRGAELLPLLVLDGPAVREVLSRTHSAPSSPTEAL